MYRTHKFHSKTVESYLSIGDPYDKKGNVDARFKGKQFQTNPAKTGQLQGYFGQFNHAVDPFQDNNGYRTTQPRQNRKLGFGSLDAHKRDEFTLDIRAQQYKELLAREQYFTQKYLEESRKARGDPQDQLDALTSSSVAAATNNQDDEKYFQTQVPRLLYDIGREDGVTPICNKCSRETFYCKHRVAGGSAEPGATSSETLRRLGPHKTSAMIVGAEVIGVAKPTHSKKSHIKEFYDNNHLSVGGNAY